MIRWIALLVGVACLAGAIWINAAYHMDLADVSKLTQLAIIAERDVSMPNWLPTGTAFGLAIAGGVCVLGACLADCKRSAAAIDRS